MFLGYISYKIIGDGYAKIYKRIIEENIMCSEIKESEGVLYLKTGIEQKSKLEELLDSLNMEYEILQRKGVFFLLKRVFNKKGLLIGGLLFFTISFVLSNIVMRFNILCDDEKIKKDVIAVLNENGVSGGSFIPSLNCTVLERELKQKVEGISWAGISTNGPTLIIDIVKKVDKPESRSIRMPCNLVANHDAVIDKIELYNGQLRTTVGSGVKKGDILVSGTVITENISYENGKEIKDVETSYVRSYGSVYGTFTDKKTFIQPFESTKRFISEDTVKRNYFKLFDLQIPLFLNNDDGNYIEETSVSDFSLLGIKLPIGIIHSTLNEYSYKSHTFTEEEALKLANQQATAYEHNFLEKYEIKNAKRSEKVTHEGVEVTVKYTLYGNISEEVEFFIAK